MSAPRSRGLGLLALLLATVSAACSGAAGDAPRVERTDSAGVAIVRNLDADRALPWRFERVLALGGADSGPESFYRLDASTVGVDARGDLFVLDPAEHRVVVFDSAGRHLRSMGREGGGPGELGMPLAMSVEPDGTVNVRDLAKTALVRWDSQGELLPSNPFPVPPFHSEFVVVAGAALTTVPTSRPGDDQMRQELRLMRGVDTTTLAAVIVPRPGMAHYGCVGLALPPLFSPELVWSARGDRVAVASGTDYVVRVVQDGRTLSIRRALEPRPVTREMALQQVGEEMKVGFGGGRPPCRIPGEQIVEKQGFAPVLPLVGALTLAPDGSLWVRRGMVKGDAPVIDVFDPEGTYLGTLPPGSPFPTAFTPRGDVVAIEKDDLDVDHLVVYRVVRGE